MVVELLVFRMLLLRGLGDAFVVALLVLKGGYQQGR